MALSPLLQCQFLPSPKQLSQQNCKMDREILELQPICSSDEEGDAGLSKSVDEIYLSRGDSLSEYMFNLKYNFVNSNLIRKPILLTCDSEPVYLLGREFRFDDLEQFLNRFRSTVWMSYRTSGSDTDAGWGCTIRAVQMVLAEALKRKNPTIDLSDIVDLFKQGTKHPFSIQNICREGNIKARWTGFNEVCSVIFSLLNKQKPQHSNLNLKIKTEIYYSTVTLLSMNKIKQEPQMFPMMLVLSNKMSGNSTMQTKFIPHISHLMKMSSFCGMISGISGEALFIAGFQEEKAIFFDPHYVQETGSEKQTYFQKTPRGVPFSKLSSSLSICFYFESQFQYQLWCGEISYLQKVYSPNTVFSLLLEDPSDDVEQYRKRSEDFEIL